MRAPGLRAVAALATGTAVLLGTAPPVVGAPARPAAHASVEAVGGLAAPAAAVAPTQEGDDGQPLTWGVRPSSASGPDGRDAFTYTLEPGDEIDDWVGISNHTDDPLALAVYASDAVTTADGGFDLLPAVEAPTDVGSWVRFTEPTVTVPPRSRLDVPFRLAVPANATPGDHPGGVVASLRTTGTDAAGGQVATDHRVGARIYLRVRGDLAPAVAVTGVSLRHRGTANPARTGDATVTYTVTNTGNVRLAVTPLVRVAGPFGLGRRLVPGEDIAELLPGSSVTRTTEVSAVAPLVRLTASVGGDATPIAIDAEAGAPPVDVARGRSTTWALPWSQALVLAAVVAAAAAWRVRRRRRAAALAAQLAAARAGARATRLWNATER